MPTRPHRTRVAGTLAIDIGGTGLKMVCLGRAGARLGEIVREPTPRRAVPSCVVARLVAMAGRAGPFDRAAVGFPGVVVGGIVHTAPNLAERAWIGLDLGATLRRALRVPVRVANDAVVQGLGVIRGRRVELVLTLGTGLGSCLFVDGRPVPLELGHLPWQAGLTYEKRVGEAARRRVGTTAWRRRVQQMIALFRAAFAPDVIYLGGGNSRLLRHRLGRGLRRVDNSAGLWGGLSLWSGSTFGARGACRPPVSAKRPRVRVR